MKDKNVQENWMFLFFRLVIVYHHDEGTLKFMGTLFQMWIISYIERLSSYLNDAAVLSRLLKYNELSLIDDDVICVNWLPILMCKWTNLSFN